MHLSSRSLQIARRTSHSSDDTCVLKLNFYPYKDYYKMHEGFAQPFGLLIYILWKTKDTGKKTWVRYWINWSGGIGQVLRIIAVNYRMKRPEWMQDTRFIFRLPLLMQKNWDKCSRVKWCHHFLLISLVTANILKEIAHSITLV